MYYCEIRDSFGDIESGCLCKKTIECAKWFEDHHINFYSQDVKMVSFKSGNLIAKHSYQRKESQDD